METFQKKKKSWEMGWFWWLGGFEGVGTGGGAKWLLIISNGYSNWFFDYVYDSHYWRIKVKTVYVSPLLY